LNIAEPMKENIKSSLAQSVAKLGKCFLSPLDLIPHSDFREKCIDLVLRGIPENIDQETYARFHELRHYLRETRVEDKRVVVFGGGTGLSNVIGGDSRLQSWARQPFTGLKEFFPKTQSIVCITDDGGSTGELIKDLPLIALGDIRHVLLSSIQVQLLQNKYALSLSDARNVVSDLAKIINIRFDSNEITRKNIEETLAVSSQHLPVPLSHYFANLIDNLFSDSRLAATLERPHCFGNLLLVSAIYDNINSDCSNSDLEKKQNLIQEGIYRGLSTFSEKIGAPENAVMPCTTTPSQLRICYTNGVEATGECKSGRASRGYPVDQVNVDFSDEIFVFDEVIKDISAADIIIMAPGSLYSSIIPIFQVPGIAEAVRANKGARKILVSNLWVQAGETDIAISDPERKFHVSDMIKAYERNIPGGTRELFREVLCLSLMDVPASILQNYALEGKIPIYLDKSIVAGQGYVPLECGIYSRNALSERHVIQHDPEMLAQAVKAVYLGSKINRVGISDSSPRRMNSSLEHVDLPQLKSGRSLYPSFKYRKLKARLEELTITSPSELFDKKNLPEIRNKILEVIWRHQDICIDHLQFVKGLVFIDKEEWKREQIWDNVFSFFDPEDFYIKIRSDQLANARNLEIAFLIALGQSLLGDYAKEKTMKTVLWDNVEVGKIYNLHIRSENEMLCYFTATELATYMGLARMCKSNKDKLHYTRIINGDEGFTPPGLLMGLLYAWYLDNRFASHIEYKMALMKIGHSNLIPEQQKLLNRRNALIDFFRETVFKK
jgi:uncharacterized cofD-like protein